MNTLSVEYFGQVVKKALDSTDVHRRFIADRQEHVYTISRNALIKQAANAFGIDVNNPSKTISGKDGLDAIKTACSTFFLKLPSTFKETQQVNKFQVEHLKATKAVFSVRVVGPTETSDVYQWIFRKLAPEKTKLYNALVSEFGEVVKKRNFLDISHEQGTQIGRNAHKLLIKEMEDFFTGRPGMSKERVDKFLLEVKTNLKNMGTSEPVSRITYKNAALNRGKEGTRDKSFNAKALKSITKSLAKAADPLVFRKVEKDILIGISKELQKVKGVKLNGFKYENVKEVAHNIIEERRKTKSSTTHVKTVTNKLHQTNTISISVILNYINAVLPGIVAQHMGSPKLNYQTGRFAQSVHVNKILTTREKLKIEYSYMLYPYKTFENDKNHPERDPRPLIDKSIRTAAQKIIKKQFDTKRLEYLV